MKKIFLFIFIFFFFILLLSVLNYKKEPSFEERRGRILSELNLAIEDARKEGKYNCCIEPPCTMCYLGDWIWKDGSCHCDEMIAKGEPDKVCPQCKKKLEEGLCKSSNKIECNQDSLSKINQYNIYSG